MSLSLEVDNSGNRANVATVAFKNGKFVIVDDKVKKFVRQQLQKIGYKVGLIPIADFMRLDEEEFLRKKIKEQRHLQDWLDAQRLQDFSSKISTFIQETTGGIETSLDAINDAIGFLKTLDPDGEFTGEIVHSLREAKEGLNTSKRNLGEINKRLQKAKEINELEAIAKDVEKTARIIAGIQRNTHILRDNVDVLLDLYDRPDSAWIYSQHKMEKKHRIKRRFSETGYLPEDAHNCQKVIKIALNLLIHETVKSDRDRGVDALISRFSKTEVENALNALKRDDPNIRLRGVYESFDDVTRPPPP